MTTTKTASRSGEHRGPAARCPAAEKVRGDVGGSRRRGARKCRSGSGRVLVAMEFTKGDANVSISDRAQELPAGPELDALFFETCWGWILVADSPRTWSDREATWHRGPEPVSTAAAACEAWAMRWAREHCFYWRIDQHKNECRTEVWRTHGGCWHVYGTDWKHALVRACICAAEALTNGEPKHD